MTKRMLTATLLSIGLAGSGVAPALADGAASTRNIIFGAAAAAGTLLIINHNKKVHQKYADDARRQADTQAQANNAQAAYESERRAYQNEVALNGEYKHEVATQHTLITALRHQVAMERSRTRTAMTQSRPAVVAPVPAPVGVAQVKNESRPLRVASTSWGWGQL